VEQLRQIDSTVSDVTVQTGAAVEIPREGPYLRPEVQELRDLHKLQEAPTDTGLSPLQDPVEQTLPTPMVSAKRPATDRKVPKWLKR